MHDATMQRWDVSHPADKPDRQYTASWDRIMALVCRAHINLLWGSEGCTLVPPTSVLVRAQYATTPPEARCGICVLALWCALLEPCYV